jgi:hypothetical protein
MQDFQRKKDSFLLFNSMSQRDNSYIYTEQSKNLYDFVLKHDNQIKRIENDMSNFKSQIIDIKMKFPLNTQTNNNSNNILSNDDNNMNNSYLNKIIEIKEDIKNDLMKDINNLLIAQKNEMKENFENLKKEIEVYNENNINKNKIFEINDNIETLNQQLMKKDMEKNNLEEVILNKISNDKIEVNNITNNINKRLDNFDLDFDRLVQSLKNQFSTNANTLNQLEQTKVNITDFENKIILMNQNFEKINKKLSFIDLQDKNIFNKKKINKIDTNDKDNIIYEFEKNFQSLKNEIYDDLEKINLKILNELKNQANDIKLLFQKFQFYEESNRTISNKDRDINFDYLKNVSLENSTDNSNKMNIISLLDSELSKKANLDQLNFALETQSRLNEAFSSASRICRFCWDSEGLLKDDKFIIWSIQNINTALDVFKWENNSENITIIKNGVYKIVFGLIGLEKNKDFGISFNDDENLVMSTNNNSTNDLENENDINNEKGNVKYLEQYIACAENTKIKAIIFENITTNTEFKDDNSEEAFLEISKII